MALERIQQRFSSCRCCSVWAAAFFWVVVVSESAAISVGKSFPKFDQAHVPSLANTSYWLSELCKTRVNGSAVRQVGLNAREKFPVDTFPRFEKAGYKCVEAIVRSAVEWRDQQCSFAVGDCNPMTFAEPYRSKVLARHSREKVKAMVVPGISKGSWGTCALVAPGESLVGAGLGRDIDSHDTVIRIQAQVMDPAKANDIGTRTDALFTRATHNYSFKRHIDTKLGYGSNLKYILGNKDYYGRFTKLPRLRWAPWDRPPSSSASSALPSASAACRKVQKKPSTSDLRNLEKAIYPLLIKKKETKPSNGMIFYMGMVWSGLCTRLDLYGYSYTHSGGGLIYALDHTVKWKHRMDIEGWLSRHLMKFYSDQTRVCVYN